MKKEKNIGYCMVVVALLLLVAGCTGQDNQEVQNKDEIMDNDVDNIEENIPEKEEQEMTNDVDKVLVLTGENFKFMMDGKENPELRVKEGQKVRIEFSSTQGLHDWVMDELFTLDDVAYIRFASVYLDFTDVGAFRDAVERLEQKTSKKKRK